MKKQMYPQPSKKPGAVTGFTAKSDHDYGGIELKWKKSTPCKILRNLLEKIQKREV